MFVWMDAKIDSKPTTALSGKMAAEQQERGLNFQSYPTHLQELPLRC